MSTPLCTTHNLLELIAKISWKQIKLPSDTQTIRWLIDIIQRRSLRCNELYVVVDPIDPVTNRTVFLWVIKPLRATSILVFQLRLTTMSGRTRRIVLQRLVIKCNARGLLKGTSR